MKMIATTNAAPITAYSGYVHNCLRHAPCEPSWAAPLPSLANLQLYVDFGTEEPTMIEIHVLNMCAPDHTEQIFPANYVVSRTPEATWYGVFKFFSPTIQPMQTFVAWLSAMVETTSGLSERTFFSELMVIEPCLPLTKIASCHPEGATTTGFDVNGLYYGLPQGDYLGFEDVRYYHVAYVRHGKVREIANKATFTSNLTRNFRTVIERTYQLDTEMVPKWYKDLLLAIYSRGAIKVNGGTTYLVSDLAFDPINEDDLTWKPFAQLKQTSRLYFGCDESICADCCAPNNLVADAFPGVGPDTFFLVDDLNNVLSDIDGNQLIYSP